MLRDDVIVFLKLNPDPEDSEVHEWAEEQNYDIREVESEIYKLATQFVNELLDDDDFDDDQD